MAAERKMVMTNGLLHDSLNLVNVFCFTLIFGLFFSMHVERQPAR